MRFLTLGMLLALGGQISARAELVEYYIGRDIRETIPTGIYAGLANPNFGRLTFLYAHTYEDTPNINHYHSKSTYTYFGPNLGGATAVQPFNGTPSGEPRNYLPEGALPPLLLKRGKGAFAGHYISGLTPGVEYADLRMKSVDALAGFGDGTPENFLWRSGGAPSPGRWTGSMAGSQLSLVLVGRSEGISVLDALGKPILTDLGDTHFLGDGGESLDFTPVFAAQKLGLHYLEFRLVDQGIGNSGGAWGESGIFRFNVRAVVPEPSSVVLVGAGLGCLIVVATWRRARLRRARRGELTLAAS